MVEVSLLSSLLQFVALAIPAIALIMDVVINLRGNPEDTDSNIDGLWLMELSLYMLLVGGLFIGYELLQHLQSPLVQLGASFILLALPSLGVAIVISLRPELQGFIPQPLTWLSDINFVMLIRRYSQSESQLIQLFGFLLARLVELLYSAIFSALMTGIFVILRNLGILRFPGDLNPLFLGLVFTIVVFMSLKGQVVRFD